MDLNTLLLSISLLIIISILIARFSNNLGVPILLLFLGVGMLAGSEGPGGIHFEDYSVAQTIGTIGLIFILFSGGLDTRWKNVRPVIIPALSLSTLGVLITALTLGLFIYLVFDVSFYLALLLGSVVSSTDAAAVFSILGYRKLNLKGNLKPLLEMESGSNDPMAIFLTIGVIQLITIKETSFLSIIGLFVFQMGIGFITGTLAGKMMVVFVNKLKPPVEGFYTVFALAFALMIYSLAASLNGSGFLAVYAAGIIFNNNEVIHKKSLVRFFDGLSWLSQIVMFLTLGLLVFPSEITPIISKGILIALFLIFVSRPLSVYISLFPFQYNWREKLLISWVGLRGAIPIILATFPMIAGIPLAGWIFNVVFFIVLISALLQGWTIPFAARVLKLDAPEESKINYPIEFSSPEDSNMQLINLKVPDKPSFINKPLVEITALKGSLIVTVSRNGHYFVPAGGTMLEPGDLVQVLTDKEKVDELRQYFKN